MCVHNILKNGQRLEQALLPKRSFFSGHLPALVFIKVTRDLPCSPGLSLSRARKSVCPLLLRLQSVLSLINCKGTLLCQKKTLGNQESSFSGSTVSARSHLRGLRGRQCPHCPGDVCAGVPAHGWCGDILPWGAVPTNPQSQPGSNPFLFIGLSELQNIPLINGKVLEARRPASHHRDPQPRTSGHRGKYSLRNGGEMCRARRFHSSLGR